MMTNHGRVSEHPGEWIMNLVTRNPEGLLLLGAGAALLMRSRREHPIQRGYVQSSVGDGQRYEQAGGSGQRIGEAVRRAGEYVSDVTGQATETARSYAASAAEYADETAQEAIDRSKDIAGRARETADYVVREQPWAVVLTGILAGAAVAAVFPSTRIEQRALGEVGERLRSAAGAAGEQLREAGIKAGERLSEVAAERGLNPKGLKEAVQDVGGSFNSALRGEESSDQKVKRSDDRPSSNTQPTTRGQSGGQQTKPSETGKMRGKPSETSPTGERR
jgi:hypothetical protein